MAVDKSAMTDSPYRDGYDRRQPTSCHLLYLHRALKGTWRISSRSKPCSTRFLTTMSRNLSSPSRSRGDSYQKPVQDMLSHRILFQFISSSAGSKSGGLPCRAHHVYRRGGPPGSLRRAVPVTYKTLMQAGSCTVQWLVVNSVIISDIITLRQESSHFHFGAHLVFFT